LTPSTTFAGGGRKNSKAVPANSVLSLSSTGPRLFQAFGLPLNLPDSAADELLSTPQHN
jgi:hypothetical protein